MAEDKKLRFCMSLFGFTTFLSFALPVLSESSKNSWTSCTDGYGLNYTLPMFERCKVKPDRNGNMVQTIPKVIPFPSVVAGCHRRKSQGDIPAGHRICRIPDCGNNLCKNGWCEETFTWFKCHCYTGFQGEHCDKAATQEATTKPTTSPSTTISVHSENATSQGPTPSESTESATTEATSKPKASPMTTKSKKSETTTSKDTTNSESREISSREATTKPKMSPTTTMSEQPETTSQETTTTTTIKSACTSPMKVSNGGSFYYFSTSEMGHSSALSCCSERNSHLVYIETEEEQDFMEDQIKALNSSVDYWIGLRGQSRADARWLDGSQLTYDNTGHNSFNGGGECFRIRSRDYDWHDHQCFKKHGYICEQEIACASRLEVQNGSSYYFITSKMNHASALSSCSEHDSHLVYIETEEEQLFIKCKMKALHSSVGYWIGLRGQSRADARWLDGSSLTYDNIEHNSFDEGGQCFRIISGDYTWRDRKCSKKFRFICEKESDD